MKKIVDFDQVVDSEEMLWAEEPNFMSIFIYLVLLLVIVTSVWIWFGTIDLVINTTGVVRTAQNISLVRNRKGGQVKEINFESGEKVEIGEKLYQLENSSLKSRRNNIVKRMEKLKIEINLLSKLRKGIEEKKNLFDEKNLKYYNRYLNYKFKYNQLRLDYQEAKNRYLKEKSLNPAVTTKNKIDKLRTEYEVAQLKMKNYRSGTLVDIQNELENKKSKLNNLEQEIINLKQKIENTKVFAPIAGTIQVLNVFNEGDYLPSGIKVLRIIPENNKITKDLRMEITIPNKDISKVKVGQQVKYRFAALPYREYGAITGEITQISKMPVSKANDQLSYKAKAKISQVKVKNQAGENKLIQPGMKSKVNIVVGRKKILYFLLDKLGFIS